MDGITGIYQASLDEGGGLLGETYTSEEIFKEETKRLFHKTWLCIGTSSDVPEIGDLSPVEFAGVPLLIVRDTQANIRVYHNLCSHRGTLLATEPRRCRGSIVCPYHGWAYNFDGKLMRTPNAGGAGKHCLLENGGAALGLTEVQSAIWNSLLFVNISGAAVPFAEHIAPIEERIGKLNADEIRYDKNLSTEMTFEANWKLVVENFVESYHLPSVHPQLERVNPMRDHYQILGGHSYLGQGGFGYSAAEEGSMAGLPLRAGADKSRYEVFYIYPNLIFGPLPNFAFVIVADPKSAEVTRERIEFIFWGDAAMDPEHEPLRRSNAEFLQLVNRQDIEICKSVQRGRRSPSFSGGVFALPQEKTSLHFLRMVAANMVATAGQTASDVVPLGTKDIFHDRPKR